LRGLGDSFSIQRDMNVTKLEQQFNEFMNQMDYRGGVKVFKRLRGGKRDVYLAMLYDHLAMQNKFRKFYEYKARYLYRRALFGKYRIEALLGLGRIYWHRNDRRALRYYKRALRYSPKDPRVLIALGNIYKAQGENKKARKYYRNAILHSKDNNFGLLLNHSLFWLKRGNAKKAQSYIKEIEGAIRGMRESKTKEIAKEQLRQIKEAA